MTPLMTILAALFAVLVIARPFNTFEPAAAKTGAQIQIVEENRQKVAIIDTGIRSIKAAAPYLCQGPNFFDLTEYGINDTHGHGTNIAGIIASQINPEKSCLLIIKYHTGVSDYYDKFTNNLAIREIKGFRIAIDQGASFINFSSGGVDIFPGEVEIIQEAIDKKIYVVVPAGNNQTDLSKTCNYYPACYYILSKYFKVVGNGETPDKKQQSTNYGGPVTDWKNGKDVIGFDIKMSGTSQSTAIKTGELVKENERPNP